MSPAEAAAEGWSQPEDIVRMRCCGWDTRRVADLMNHRVGVLDPRGPVIHQHGGWNHLAQALLHLVLTSQDKAEWKVVDLKEKWGHMSFMCDPATAWRHGALLLFFAVSGRTCVRCGRPGSMLDHCAQHFGVRPLCDECETLWRADEERRDGHLRRTIAEQAAAEGREEMVD